MLVRRQVATCGDNWARIISLDHEPTRGWDFQEHYAEQLGRTMGVLDKVEWSPDGSHLSVTSRQGTLMVLAVAPDTPEASTLAQKLAVSPLLCASVTLPQDHDHHSEEPCFVLRRARLFGVCPCTEPTLPDAGSVGHLVARDLHVCGADRLGVLRCRDQCQLRADMTKNCNERAPSSWPVHVGSHVKCVLCGKIVLDTKYVRKT